MVKSSTEDGGGITIRYIAPLLVIVLVVTNIATGIAWYKATNELDQAWEIIRELDAVYEHQFAKLEAWEDWATRTVGYIPSEGALLRGEDTEIINPKDVNIPDILASNSEMAKKLKAWEDWAMNTVGYIPTQDDLIRGGQ